MGCGVYVTGLLSGVPRGNGTSIPMPKVLRIEAKEDPIEDPSAKGRDGGIGSSEDISCGEGRYCCMRSEGRYIICTDHSSKLIAGGGCCGNSIVDIKWRSGQSFGFRCFARIVLIFLHRTSLSYTHRPPPDTDRAFPLAFYSLSFNLPSLRSLFV